MPVYYEAGFDIYAVIGHEKQVKAGSRLKKIDLINRLNPGWEGLFDEMIRKDFFAACCKERGTSLATTRGVIAKLVPR